MREVGGGGDLNLKFQILRCKDAFFIEICIEICKEIAPSPSHAVGYSQFHRVNLSLSFLKHRFLIRLREWRQLLNLVNQLKNYF